MGSWSIKALYAGRLSLQRLWDEIRPDFCAGLNIDGSRVKVSRWLESKQSHEGPTASKAIPRTRMGRGERAPNAESWVRLSVTQREGCTGP